MNPSSLYPPNVRALSDQVIGKVVPRTWPASAVYRCTQQPDTGSPHERPVCDSPARASPTLPPCENASQNAASSQLSKKPQERGPGGPLFMSSRVKRALQSIAILQASGIDVDSNLQCTIMEEVLKKKDRHRLLQASYRERLQKSAEVNAQEVRRLQLVTKELQGKVRALTFGNQPKLNHGVVAARYEHHFRCFLSDPVRQRASAVGFLLCIMTPAAASNSVDGVEAILDNWRLVAKYFDDVTLEINDLSKLAATDALVGTTITSITIGEHTLRDAFPRLNSDGKGGLEGGEWPSDATKLLGKRLVMRGSTHFYLDNVGNRVVQITSQADMLSPMLRILGSLTSVHQVFERALITPDFRFK